MPKTVTEGTGSTQRPRLQYDLADPADAAASIEHVKRLPPDFFAAKLSRCRQLTSHILTKAGIDPADRNRQALVKAKNLSVDSDEGYAARILTSLDFLENALAKNDARNAADHAWDIGALFGEWNLKPLADPKFNMDEARRLAEAELARAWADVLAEGLGRLQSNPRLKTRQVGLDLYEKYKDTLLQRNGKPYKQSAFLDRLYEALKK